jgi:lipoate-protein ligase B
MTICRAIQLGVLPYKEALSLQKQLVERLQNGDGDDSLLLLEHPHVITLGRNANGEALLAGQSELDAKGVQLVYTDRGGDATYHGPGQLVGYPLIRLEEERRDIRRFVHDLEAALIRVLADFEIGGSRHPEHRGVWVGGRKIASIGIRISRWVTCHGFALNVNTNLSYFSLIEPCGINTST